MRILCIGDVCGNIGCSFLLKNLSKLKSDEKIDICIVNGENSADGNGISLQSADMIFTAGADVITGGNHSFKRKEIYDRFENDEFLLCPQNATVDAPKKGIATVDLGYTQISVLNLCGRVYMNDAENPFTHADSLIGEAHSKGSKIIILDFHAEATAEKLALAHYLDGKVSAVFGTHTHVATADEKILPGGTGYITDIGMTGPADSILGVKTELSIAKIKDGAPVKFELATGECKMEGCIFEVDNSSGKCRSVKRISIK